MGPWLVLLMALLYIVVFGGLGLLRREPLSLRFAVESLAFTALIYGIYWVSGFLMSPVLFVLLLYVITMRAQILVDAGNLVARMGKWDLARSLYGLGERLSVSDPSRWAARINTGACFLKEGRLEEAVQSLAALVGNADRGNLPPKHEAACRYNLGLALMRSGKCAEAVHQLNEVIELLPGSVYAIGASAELKRYRQKTSGQDQPCESETETKP
ncbi:MAG: tetratricopeptide repeat protein [Anaerolineae bacterium]|nr:tetratricopeptide repeat protein [Anaerolineae bacterium]